MNEKDGRPDDLDELTRQASAGDLWAKEKLFSHPKFDRMVEIHCRSALRSGRGHGELRDLADLKQRAYMRISCTLSQFKGGSADAPGERNPLAAWLKKVVWTVYLREAYRGNRDRATMESFAQTAPRYSFEPSPEMEVSLTEFYQQLGPEEKRILDLLLEGFNPREITAEVYASQWQGWDQRTRKNETEKTRKKATSIQERMLAALGLKRPKSKKAQAG